MLSLLSITKVWAEDVVYKTALFGSGYNSKSVSGYTESWSSTNGDFTVNLTNFNNNNNGWNYVKCGRKNNASVGSITTSSIDKAITKVNVTVDACTVSKVNSFTLYVASNLEFTADLQTIPVIISNGVKTFTVTTPTANCYYKLVVDCASGSSNGLVTISKVEYYKAEDATPTCATPTFTPAGGITFYGSQDVELASTTSGAAIHYTLDGSDPTSSSSTYSAPINLTSTTTIKAIAVKNGMEDSEIASATYTAGEAVTSYDIDFETNNLEAYVNWEFNNIACATNTITAHQGDYYGNTGGKASASITTRAKYANPGIFSFYTSKESGNTTASTWSVQVSEDGEEWTEVESFDATTGSKGTWTEREADLSAFTNVFIRVLYSGSTAVRAIDDISLKEASSVAKPTFSGDVSFLTSTEVSLACTTEGSTIYYTTDGSDPKTSGTEYSAPFTLIATSTVKAAAKVGSDWSDVAEQTYTKIYTITVAAAVAAIPNVDDVVNDQYVAGIVCTEAPSVSSGKMTYYISDDGSETNRLQIYHGKNLNNTDFTSVTDLVLGDRVVVFGQLKNYKGTPEMNDGNYLVAKEDPTVAAPVFNPDGGGFMGETDVTITCATTGSTIYYTTDETTPSKSSTPYTAAIHINATTTIKAIAYVGDESSLVITKTFTLTAPMTVAEALEALDTEDPINNAAVAGIVCSVTSISSGHATYYISDDGTDTGDKLEVYNGYGLNGEAFADGGIQVGDQVTVFGDLTVFQSTTKEFSAGSRLLTFNRPTIPVTGVKLPATASVKKGKTITLTPTIEPTNASNKNVTWSITSGSDYASVSEEGVVTGLAAGEAVIQVETEDGGYTASCTVTVAEAPDFANGDWMLVTDANELTAGSYVIIAAAEYDKAMKPYVSGNNCKSKDATKSGSMITYDSEFGIFAVQAGTKENTIALFDEDNNYYLYAASGSSNYLKGETELDDNGSWTVSVADGVATLTAQGTNTRNIIKYNAAEDQKIFSCYASTSTNMKAIALYKYYAPVPKVLYDKNTEEDVTNLPGTTRAELEDNVYKATISTTTPHRSGYQFTGWKDADNNDYIAGSKYTITDDITLYAQWNVLAGHHITYVTVGTAPTDENTYYAGDVVTLASADGLSNPGYVFDGWNDGANTYPANYEEYQMPDNDVTFTAVWSRVSTQKWVLVENLSDIKTDGTEYVIAAAGYNVAMAALSGDIYTTTPVVKNGNILTGSESMIPLTFVAGSGDGVLAMKHGDLYLASTAEKKMTERETAFYWTVSIADGVTTFETLIGTNPCHLQYNSGSPRFTTYKSTQKPLAIYEKAPMVEINDGETVQASNVPGADIVIYDGGTLAVDNDATIGDLTVEEGGKVTLSNKKLTVTGTFAIETSMGSGKSGELSDVNGSNFAVTGDAYIDITLGDNGNADKWHAFTVPFPVDALNGIFDLDGNKLTNEQNYAIMDYHGDIRAQGKYGWKKFRGTLVPGTFYLMTVDGLRTTYRMKMKAGSNVVADNKKDFYKYAASGEGQPTDAGWNGIGNPTLAYGKVNVAVQVLDPVNYVYETKNANSCNFIVGTPFFYQAAADGSISMIEANASTYYAPIRKAVKTTEQIKVSLANENYTDNLFISASEDATNNYQIGKDLVKMTMTNTPIVPQIFGVAYKTQLSMVHAPLVGDRANYTLNLYAPADGEYTISAQQTDDAIVYLTYEGSPIWNITAGEYNCDLQKGNNSGFGLMLVRRAPQVTTDIEGANPSQNGVRKLLINGQLFIEKEGKLFNVTGQRL